MLVRGTSIVPIQEYGADAPTEGEGNQAGEAAR